MVARCGVASGMRPPLLRTPGNWRRARTTALSHNDFRVDGLQLDPRVVDVELPVDAALLGVASLMPGGSFRSQKVDRREASVPDALTSHGTQLVLGNVQPTSVLGRVAEFQATHDR